MGPHLTREVAGKRPATLEIYVTNGCAGCRTALAFADALRRQRPAQPVQVIDIVEHTGPLPAGVVGVPTYRLDGEVISLGNPDWQDLLRRVDITRG